MERVYTTVDKSEWGPGEWQDEPDKVQWKDERSGLACLVKRGPVGAWCGYVGVAPDHPAFEKDYDDVDVEVHGGLTYAAACQHGPEESSICHIPDPGEPDNVWWFGFDCAHLHDLAPAMAARDRERGWAAFDVEEYRDVDYARRETSHLAEQLADLAA